LASSLRRKIPSVGLATFAVAAIVKLFLKRIHGSPQHHENLGFPFHNVVAKLRGLAFDSKRRPLGSLINRVLSKRAHERFINTCLN
jgi:hypothetical protein